MVCFLFLALLTNEILLLLDPLVISKSANQKTASQKPTNQNRASPDILEKEFPDFHCKLIKNKQKNNSYFAKFETVGHAGFIRAHLDGKNIDGGKIKVQFVCSPQLKSHLFKQ